MPQNKTVCLPGFSRFAGAVLLHIIAVLFRVGRPMGVLHRDVNVIAYGMDIGEDQVQNPVLPVGAAHGGRILPVKIHLIKKLGQGGFVGFGGPVGDMLFVHIQDSLHGNMPRDIGAVRGRLKTK